MNIGQTLPQIILPAIDGSEFDSRSLKGKRVLVTFFRFATCPFCNLRVSQLLRAKDELGDKFQIVAIFESELEHLKKHANKHMAGFPILADYDHKYYEMFGVKKSLIGMVKGMLFRLPSLFKSVLSGNIPREISSRLLIMPLSLLVDEHGIVQEIYHGKDEGDHIPIDRVLDFSKF
ncbi:MAG: redoxin domain-containing protein [Gammaproteobacteria bacterium]|nr:redoxin domain-containing protein [Gammaproteobacteria bacterium]